MERGELTTLALFDKPDPLDGPYFEETLYVTPSRLPGALQECIHREVARACGVAGLVYGAGYLVVGTAPVLGVAAAGALLAHLGGGAQWTLSTYGLQAAVPDYIRGRVFAADFALVTVTMSLSLMASGALAEVTGPRPPTLVLAGVSCLWGVAYLTLTRPLRRAGGVGAISSAASTP